MKKGFVLGKFMPLHKGHLALFDFASRNCDELYIILCYTAGEPIPGIIRRQWLDEEMKNKQSITIVSFPYDETELSNTSSSSREVSALWAKALKKIIPDVNIFFSSEPYGEYVAEFMEIKHMSFDENRNKFSVSASKIRSNPFQYWDFIAESAKSYYIKKIALVGSESTGKTTLTKKLADYYNTVFVPEMAREIIEKTDECTYEDLFKIAELHATAILKKTTEANKLLFVDTDITITRSYSVFLFKKELITTPWMEEANHFDLYLFLEPDCEYVQDGTRISESERNKLSDHHKERFRLDGIPFVSISGDWAERFSQAKKIIDGAYF